MYTVCTIVLLTDLGTSHLLKEILFFTPCTPLLLMLALSIPIVRVLQVRMYIRMYTVKVITNAVDPAE